MPRVIFFLMARKTEIVSKLNWETNVRSLIGR
jgi:hypothetical protein